MLIKTRVIIHKNKKTQKHLAFYFVVYECMQLLL
jgi:hypothetical protein